MRRLYYLIASLLMGLVLTVGLAVRDVPPGWAALVGFAFALGVFVFSEVFCRRPPVRRHYIKDGVDAPSLAAFKEAWATTFPDHPMPLQAQWVDTTGDGATVAEGMVFVVSGRHIPYSAHAEEG